MPVVLATQEIRRIMIQSKPQGIVHETLSPNHPTQKRAGRVAQVVEHLPSKYEQPLVQTPVPPKNKREREICQTQWFKPIILASWETETGRMMLQGQPRQIVHETPPISKIPRTKWTRGVAQAVEYLTCKHEALRSNTSPTQKKRERNLDTDRQRKKADKAEVEEIGLQAKQHQGLIVTTRSQKIKKGFFPELSKRA
jgi:hypothetical protein